MHYWWDARRNRKKLKNLRLSVADLLQGVPKLTLPTGQKPSKDSQKEVRDYNLDVIINCGGTKTSNLGSYARTGIWSFGERGLGRWARGSYFPASPKNPDRVSRIDLIAHRGAERGPRTLGHSVLKNPQSLSLIDADEVEGQVAAELVCWKLWQLHESGLPDEDCDQSQLASPPKTRGGRRNSESAGGLAFLRDYLSNRIATAGKPAGTREWQIGLRRARDAAPWEGPADDFQWIEAASGHYLADPFLFEHQGRTWLFAEDYVNAESKGRLVCAPLEPDGQLGAWQTVLDLPCHLSFPYVFAHGGDIYLIPESSAGGSVDLYRAVDFPCRWTKLRTLWAGPALDTVPYLAEDGCWYFFTSVQSHKLLPPQLLLFTAPDLLATWRLHPASPLSLDVRYARNAGRIQEIADESGKRRLIRPSQDGSGKYGSKMHFHEIEVLTPERYVERLVATRLPPSGRDGIHQYDRAGDWEVIDAGSCI
jgi:hypothetical protein